MYEESVLVPGTDLLEILEVEDDDRLASYLRRWVAIADSEAALQGGYEPDLLPHNLVETADGSLEVIDREWLPSALSRDQFLARGVLMTALKLVFRTPPSRWPCATVGEAAARMGAMVGLDPSGDWLAPAVHDEAEFQAEVLLETGWDLKAPTQVGSLRRNLEQTLAMPLSELPLGPRDHERLVEAHDAYDQVLSSASWRLTRPVRTVSKLARRRLRTRS
jgi:hypothetical protein